MDAVEKLLKYIQKTNPSMTRERLIHELGKCEYSAKVLINTYQNYSNTIANK